MDSFRPADHWTDCPECDDALGWNNEDGLAGQECFCGYVFRGEDDPAVVAASEIKHEPSPRSRLSDLAERVSR